MNECRPSFARQMSLTAMAVLSTLVASSVAMPLIGLTESGRSVGNAVEHLMKSLVAFQPFIAVLCGTAMVCAPILVRYARVQKLWHVAILIPAALVLSTGLL